MGEAVREAGLVPGSLYLLPPDSWWWQVSGLFGHGYLDSSLNASESTRYSTAVTIEL